MAKTSAFAVANLLLSKARDEGIPITHLKLQKLVYFCYAWFAGNEREELFGEDIEAWQYGPVVRELYLEFRRCGSAPIDRLISAHDWTTGHSTEPLPEPELADELAAVWDAYKNKTAGWLVEASHTRDEPWAFVARQFGPNSRRRIPFDLVRNIYADRVSKIAA